MKWKIVMDSSCDMREMNGLPKNTEFEAVPMHIQVGDTEFIDKKGLNTKAMMETVYAYEGVSRTACPGPKAWREAFSGADHVIVITISSQLSGSYDSACVAKHMMEEEEDCPGIFILDSRSTGPQMGLLARKAKKLIAEGKSFEEVCRELTEYHEKTGVFCILEKIENLVKNGRVKKLTAIVAGLLNILIIAKGSEEGTIEMVSKDRGKEKSYRKLVEKIKAEGNIKRILISHCDNVEGAKTLAKKLQDAFENATIKIQPTCGLCSFYAETRGLIIAYEKE